MNAVLGNETTTTNKAQLFLPNVKFYYCSFQIFGYTHHQNIRSHPSSHIFWCLPTNSTIGLSVSTDFTIARDDLQRYNF